MFELSLVFAIITGYLRNGKLKRLIYYHPISYFYLLLIALFLQLCLIFLKQNFAAYLLLLSSYLLFLTTVWLNRKNEFIFLILIGLILNFLVIAINGGMPISFQAAKILGINFKTFLNKTATGQYIPLIKTTKLRLLADIIPLPKPYFLPKVISIGDIFMSIGLFFFIQSKMIYIPKRKKQ